MVTGQVSQVGLQSSHYAGVAKPIDSWDQGQHEELALIRGCLLTLQYLDRI